ncbi:MAG TPA: YihY/virulence factor BrkB family protein [Bryobacteraceae bacterium]|nr:YihY/virulence factor BrkB family protein [Bryobacteraceae bacterium]
MVTAAGGARRYRKPLKSFRWRDIVAILTVSFAAWGKHKAPRLGASLAFYTLLSIAPLLLVLVSVAGLILGHQTAEMDIVSQIRAVVGDQGGLAARALLEGSRNTTHGVLATVFGVLVLLFGASGVLIELQDALNTIWEVPTPELSAWKKLSGLIKERLFSFALLLAIGFIMAVSLAVSAWIAALGSWSTSLLPAYEAALHVLNFVVSFLVITGLFSAIYKFLPDVQIEWRDVLLGGAVTSILFGVGKLVLGIYLGKASFASTYGAAASLVVLVVWVYYSGQIFFLGAEFTKTFANCYGSQPGRSFGDLVAGSPNTKPAPGTANIIIPSEIGISERERQPS